MATLAEILRQTGYAKDGQLQAPAPTQPNLSTMSGDYIRQLPQKFNENQAEQMAMLARAFPDDTLKNADPKVMAEMAMQVPLGGTVKNIAKSLQDKGLILDVYESAKTPQITLSRIEVPKEMRSKGMGTEALNDLSQYADETGKTVVLSPSTDFGASSVSRLKDFYKRFGFVENKGRNKDFSISESMYRLPTEQTRKELIQQQIDKIE
jgi:GNAT superfamily N-acetyltransferase